MWKGRTGAGWSFLSTLVMIAAWVFADSARMTDPAMIQDETAKLAAAILGIGGGGIVMLLIIASLPSRRRTPAA
jgi:hypothetical protein